MRARVLVGEISRRSTGATRSGLIGKSSPEGFVRRAIGFAGLQIEQPVGIDGDGVGLDRGGRRDRAGDDLGLHQQALRPRVDQAGAELREVENARHQRDQAGEIERNDAAGEAREAEREEELTGAAQPAERPLPAPQLRAVDGSAIERESGRDALGIQAWIRLRSIEQWPKLPVVFDGVFVRRRGPYPTPDGRRRQLTIGLRAGLQIRFP